MSHILFINVDEIPEHPDGLERMQILREHYDEGSTMEGMYQLMQCVKYPNTYYASSGWYSELGFTYDELLEIAKNPADMDKTMKQVQEEFEEEPKSPDRRYKQYISLDAAACTLLNGTLCLPRSRQKEKIFKIWRLYYEISISKKIWLCFLNHHLLDCFAFRNRIFNIFLKVK